MPSDPFSAGDVQITLTSSPASDSWGFVGVVHVGEYEAYRTIRAYTSPQDAVAATQQTLAGVLGTLMAGQEWLLTQNEVGHPPRRVELEFGLRARLAHLRDEARAEPNDPEGTDVTTRDTVSGSPRYDDAPPDARRGQPNT